MSNATNQSSEIQLFAKAGFVARAKGQRRAKDLIPDFLGSDGSASEFAVHPTPENPVVLVTLLGVWVPNGGYCRGRQVHCWSVQLQSGLLVPAYSLGSNYNICQHSGYMPRQGE